MSRRALLALLAALAAAVAAWPAAAFGAGYTVTDLGRGRATGINRYGTIVGWVSTRAGADAFYVKRGRRHVFEPFGFPNNVAYGINDHGQIVGSGTVDPGFEHATGYRYSIATQAATDYGGAPFNLYTVNNAGQVGGDTEGHGSTVPWFSGSAGAGLPDECVPSGGGAVRATVVKNVVVGDSTIVPCGGPHAFLGTVDGARDLGTLGGEVSRAFGINRSTVIVGDAQIATGELAPFRWDGAMHRLPLPAFASGGTAQAINSGGVAVGRAYSAHGQRALVWWRNGRVRNLNRLIPTGSGWTLNVALALNDSQEIVGFGRLRGAVHAFLLRPVS